MAMSEDIHHVVEAIYRTQSRRILATLIRLLGDFDVAEDALHDAFRAALEQWPREGMPANADAWLISAGRFKGIDRLRKNARLEPASDVLETLAEIPPNAETESTDALADDRLRLIFICCHPALPSEARAALTLREVCGLTTEEIARAFLTTPATLAQRIVRAKNKIREEHIPYEVPSPADLSARLDAVLQIIYLVFNEGYYASSGQSLVRTELSHEALRLGRLLLQLLPEPDVMGLVALMLLHESRRPARVTTEGEVILLNEQDRRLWNREQIKEGISFVEQALKSHRFGPYTLQAAIAAVHAEAPDAKATDWAQITALYDKLFELQPSPVIELNRAVAVAMRDGPEVGLTLVDDLLARGELDDYAMLYSVRADLCRRTGNIDAARSAYKQALAKARQEPERRFLEKRLVELG